MFSFVNEARPWICDDFATLQYDKITSLKINLLFIHNLVRNEATTFSNLRLKR